MRHRPHSFGKDRAFTLVEMMIAATIGTMAMIAAITGIIACQKVFWGADGGLKANADQLRILDYVERDVRQALTVVVSNSGQTLTLTTPDYIDSTTGNPRIPSLTPGTNGTTGMPNGTVNYGSSTSPVTVIYFPSNGPAPYTYSANGQYMIRQVGSVQTVISRDCTNLTITFTDQTTSVLTTITFQPRFTFQSTSNPPANTMVYATPLLRNNRRN